MSGTAIEQAHAGGSALTAIGSMLVSLALVIALIMALAWVLRRISGPGGPQRPAGLRVVSSLPVGPKERVLVIDVGGRQVLVGVTANQISLLHELPEPLPAPAVPASFAAMLADRFGRQPS